MLLFAPSAHAQLYSPNWAQDVQEMVEAGRIEAAVSMLEAAESRVETIADEGERIDHLLKLSDLFHQMNRQKRAEILVQNALKRSFAVQDRAQSLAKLSAVLGSEIVIEEVALRRQLLQQILDKKIIQNSSDAYDAANITAMVEAVKASLTPAQLRQILEQVMKTNQPVTQNNVFASLAESTLEASANASSSKASDPLRLPIGLDLRERFLWYAMAAKYYAATGQSYRLNAEKQSLSRAYDQLSEGAKQQHRPLFRQISKL